mgnify:CR=1 FL=1
MADHSISAGREEWRKGWPAVAVATVGMATGAGLYHYVSSLFIYSLEAEFGWSRGDISNASAFGLLAVFSAPLIGRLADRLGSRRIAIACILTLAACYFALSNMTGAYWQFLLISAVLGVAAPGCTTLIYGRAVNSWFDQGKGIALGIAAAGMSIGAMLFSPLIRAMIAKYGSSGGYLTLTGLMLLIALPTVSLWLREKKTQPKHSESRIVGARSSPEVNWIQLTKGRTFWTLAVAILAANAPAAGVLTQFEPLVREHGISDPTLYLTLYAASVLFGRIAIGWLFDKFDARRVAALVTLGGITGSLLLVSSSPALAIPFAIILIGFLSGAETDVLAYFVGRHFGTTAFSTMYGLLFGISVIGTAAGIVGFGQLFDIYGSYDLALYAAAGLLVPAIIAYLVLPTHPKGAIQ